MRGESILAENCYPAGLNSPRWLQWVAVVVTVAMICLIGAGIASAVTWSPDKATARVMKAGYEKARPGSTVTEVACMKLVLPKRWGATIGVPISDCVLVTVGPRGGGSCYEVRWEQNGPAGARVPCAMARLALRKDVKPSAVLHFRVGPAA